ncbi:hypothetical protein KFL_000950150 [Klebsormidium nitens]|uniref:Uncharacterized protein n=1 Tax=Klebsormidium nitens TaxID=105231 RepID=A0A1Y1HXP3_KLENI|nr:hypothetical protein KFL_000950150 [Klebsormidium nitens]|eukprot:GAQ81939.1 hypothetical protein KFL_000950150 [Klebsormidium nitens]
MEAQTDHFSERLRAMGFGARESSSDVEHDSDMSPAPRRWGNTEPSRSKVRRSVNFRPELKSGRNPLERAAASSDGMARVQTGAALGACRERCRDLEWRLQMAEETIQRQTQELTNLRMQNATEAQQERVEARLRRIEKQKEVDSIMLRHERRRAAFSPPRTRLLSPPRLGSRVGSSPSLKDFGSPPRYERGLVSWDSSLHPKAGEFPTDSDEAFRRYMADFQLETDRLRARLGISSTG